jgi:hypothetical protein
VTDVELLKNDRIVAGRSTTGVVTLMLAAVLFLATVVLGFSTIARMHDSVQWGVHTFNTRSQIRSLRTFSADLVAQIVTAAALNDSLYVNHLQEDLAGQQQAVSHLQSLTLDNPSQQDRLARLQPLLLAIQNQVAPCPINLQCLSSASGGRPGFLRAFMIASNKPSLFSIPCTAKSRLS